MKIAILGGGFTGLSAAYYLSTKGHTVTIFEKAPVLGGLAVGFKSQGWDWPLERAYHHIFASDHDIINLAKETDFQGIFFRSVHSDSLYKVGDNYRIFPVDSPQDFLKFPLLPMTDKIRGAAVLAFLKFSPHLKIYDQMTSEVFAERFMGKKMWSVFIQELFRKKFGKYAGKILMSWLWSRTAVRTKQLGYMKGGFQTFVQHLENVNKEENVTINKATTVLGIKKQKDIFTVQFDKDGKSTTEQFDTIISTLPSPLLAKVGEHILPTAYTDRFKKLEYLSALVLIVETKKPILEETYWLNVCTPDLPMMFVGQHTNFIDKKNYNNNHIAYVANYLPADDPLLKLSDEEVFDYYSKYIKKINPKYQTTDTKYYVFRAPFAQPIFDKEFLKNKPDFKTPVPNFFVANLDMTYPYDRGTNYAVRLGRQVADMITSP